MRLQKAILTSYTADFLSKVLKDVENSIKITMFHVKHSEQHYDTSVSRETTVCQQIAPLFHVKQQYDS